MCCFDLVLIVQFVMGCVCCVCDCVVYGVVVYGVCVVCVCCGFVLV